MEKVSVIVPIHNAEPYLEQCIESILGQSYKNMEVFLLEDASKDKSQEICKKYADSPKVTLYTKRVGSAGKSRDFGLSQATGKYVLFVDADDYFYASDAIERMIEKAESEMADIVVGNYARLWEGRLLAATGHDVFSKYDRESVAFRFDGFFRVGTLSYVWAKLYRRDFLLENKIHFKEYIYGEDKLFNCECYAKQAKYAFLEDKVYVYRKNEKSISFTYRKDSKETWLAIANDLKQKKVSEDLIGNTIFFAAFFDAKQEYEYKQKDGRAVKELLKCYAEDTMAKEYFVKYADYRAHKQIPSVLWRLMISGFSVAMKQHRYGLLVLGIKLLVDLRIDERLSDTGKRD